MLDERKAAILQAVVTEYIETAQPVGSGHVTRSPEVGVSAATVRNEMVALEREGYLHQPHTSAGRVPTDKGYRFFVDNLAPGGLEPGQRVQVRDFFARAHGELEQMLDDTSNLLSRLTDYAAVIVGPAHEQAIVRAVQLVDLAPRLVLCVVVLSNGTVERRSVELRQDVSEQLMADASTALARLLIGRPLATQLGPLPRGSATEPAIAAVVDAVMAALEVSDATEAEHVFVGGASRMASAFDAVDTVRSVLSILEQQFLLVTLLRDVVDQGLSVAIGTEHGVAPLSECAVVVAPFSADGEQTGSIGVLGPTRMDYAHAMAAVAVVSRRLGRHLTEG